MNKVINRVSKLLFFLILVASLGGSYQYSNAGSNQTQAQLEGNITTLENQTRQSEEISRESEYGTNISASILPEQTPAMSNFSTQTPNLSENAYGSNTSMLQRKFLESNKFGPAIFDTTYRVTVTFDSITVHDDHDHCTNVLSRDYWSGACSGSGEWYLFATVQGIPIDLKEASNNQLWDVDDEETINFKPGTQVTVDIRKGLPLSIWTVGKEFDHDTSCDFVLSPSNMYPWDFGPKVLKGSPSTWYNAILDYQFSLGSVCPDEDSIGLINKIYERPIFGQGAHVYVRSSTEDFTLRFTVTVPPPSQEPTVEPGLDCYDDLGISRVNSSGSQNSFPPEKAIDNDLSTYWASTHIVRPEIILDLGAQRLLCGIKIVWQDGNSHPYQFNITVSKNGTTYDNVFTGTSTGDTTSAYVNEVEGRFLKITITKSDPESEASTAKISEIDVIGRFTGNEPTPGTGNGPVLG